MHDSAKIFAFFTAGWLAGHVPVGALGAFLTGLLVGLVATMIYATREWKR